MSTDFRGKTCGECVWGFSEDDNHKWLLCRRVSFNTITDEGAVYKSAPACRAFEPLEKPEEDAE